MRIAVFGYGSLVSQTSLTRTLGRRTDLIPATLKGWARSWSAILENDTNVAHYILKDGTTPQNVAVLNIQPSEDSQVNGVLIGCSQPDLDHLISREVHYDLVDLTNQIGSSGFDKIYSFTAKPEFTDKGDKQVIIPLSYKELVEQGFKELGSEEVDKYFKTTLPSDYPVAETIFIK